MRIITEWRNEKKELLAAAIVLCMVIQLLCACGKQKISMSDRFMSELPVTIKTYTFLSELLVCFKEDLIISTEWS